MEQNNNYHLPGYRLLCLCNSGDNRHKRRKMTTKEQKEQVAAQYHDERVNNSTHSHYKAFIAGADWAESQIRWIPVSERMPPKDPIDSDFSIECLLLINNYDHTYIRVGYYGTKWNISEQGVTHNNVTHWQPLPAPPAREGEGK